MSLDVFDGRYIASEDTEYKMKEKDGFSITNDDFAVIDHTGKVAFEVDAKVFSLRQRRKLKDANGEVIATMLKKVVSAHVTWILYKGDSDDTADMICEFDADFLGNSVSVEWAIPDQPKVEADGNFLGYSYDLEISRFGPNKKLASISKKFSLFGGDEEEPQTYSVLVKEGNDAAFAVACVIAIDESRNDEDEGRVETLNVG